MNKKIELTVKQIVTIAVAIAVTAYILGANARNIGRYVAIDRLTVLDTATGETFATFSR